jgi:hypothetical protein
MVEMSHIYAYALRNSYVGFQQWSKQTTARSTVIIVAIININSNSARIA